MAAMASRRVDGRPSWRRRLMLGLGVLVLVVEAAGAALWFRSVAVLPDQSIHVRVRAAGVDQTVRVPASDSVADALARAGVEPHDGRLLSARDKSVVDPHAYPARITIDGRPGTTGFPLADGATVSVVDGTDQVEPTVVVREPIPAPEMPPVLVHVYEQGHDGLRERVVGSVSREEVTSKVLRDAVAPARTTRRVVALTFDDGPNATWTPQFLDLLKAKGVKATFCEVGKAVDQHPELVQRVVAEGHQLCNHTLTHDEKLKGASKAQVDAEIGGGLRAFTTEGLPKPAYYRPPGGALDDRIKEVARSYQEQVIYWKVDTNDWRTGATIESIMGHVDREVDNGAIILLHDGGGSSRGLSLLATGMIIDHLRAQGYEFVFPIIAR